MHIFQRTVLFLWFYLQGSPWVEGVESMELCAATATKRVELFPVWSCIHFTVIVTSFEKSCQRNRWWSLQNLNHGRVINRGMLNFEEPMCSWSDPYFWRSFLGGHSGAGLLLQVNGILSHMKHRIITTGKHMMLFMNSTVILVRMWNPTFCSFQSFKLIYSLL